MKHRAIVVRLVLIVAALATVATSAPADIVLSKTIQGTLGAGTRRISVSANRAAVDHADYIRLEIGPAGSSTSAIFDNPDPTLPIVLDSLDTTRKELRFDIETLCVRERDCDASLTFEVQTTQSGPVEVDIAMTFVRAGDTSFFFPDNPPFPKDAAIDVRIEP